MKTKELIVAGALLTLVTYTVALSLGSQVFARARLDQESRKVPNVGEVRAYRVGVYQEMGCTQKLKSIDWGVLEPGSSKNFTCYVQNERSVVSTLSVTTSEWDPPDARDYLTLSWDYSNQSIDADEVIQVTFTLYVDANIEGITNFKFQITIAGNS